MIHTVVENGILVLWFVFFGKKQAAAAVFLNKKTSAIKGIRQPLLHSQTSLSLQPVKPCQVERGQFYKGVRGWKQLHRIRRLGTSFFVLFPLSRLKQAVVAGPCLCLVKNKHILLDASVCLMGGWLSHSNAHEVPPVSDMAGI